MEHAWYQWVGMMLFGQSFTFYIGHFLWKSCEGRRVERLVTGQKLSPSPRLSLSFSSLESHELSQGIVSPTANEDVKAKHCTAIAEFFYHNKKRNSLYGARFVICEMFNIVNVTVQIYLIDKLLGGEFSSYGLKVLHFAFLDDEERDDPMVKIFPKVTKCTFHNFGVSGSIQK